MVLAANACRAAGDSATVNGPTVGQLSQTSATPASGIYITSMQLKFHVHVLLSHAWAESGHPLTQKHVR
jgi:hypothetical protein